MCVSTIWSPRPADLQLPGIDVHVWRAFLDSEHAGRVEAVLSGDERARAARFVLRRDRDNFVAARGILRSILSLYLQRPASGIEFTYTAEGKPRLQPLDSDPSLCFNLSHSHGLAVYAFSCHGEVGIDAEAVQSSHGSEEVADRFFSKEERAALRDLPPEMRDEGFFLCWTRKEAYIKAVGSGLGIPLDSFHVSLTPGKPEELASSDSDRWMMRSFKPAEGFVGAVVAEGKQWKLRFLDWASVTE